jgi:hypothetical protein
MPVLSSVIDETFHYNILSKEEKLSGIRAAGILRCTAKFRPERWPNWSGTVRFSCGSESPLRRGRWFRAVDKDGNGKITSDELQRLSFGGVGLSASTAKTLVRVFDKDNNGTIDFYEYAALHKARLLLRVFPCAG